MTRRRWTCPSASRDEAAWTCPKLAVELGIAAATLYRWKHQALIDAGRKPGVKSYEPDELAPARRRIKELESEVGLPLFDRTSRRVKLTPLGTQLCQDLRPAYDQIVAAEGIARRTPRTARAETPKTT